MARILNHNNPESQQIRYPLTEFPFEQFNRMRLDDYSRKPYVENLYAELQELFQELERRELPIQNLSYFLDYYNGSKDNRERLVKILCPQACPLVFPIYHDFLGFEVAFSLDSAILQMQNMYEFHVEDLRGTLNEDGLKNYLEGIFNEEGVLVHGSLYFKEAIKDLSEYLILRPDFKEIQMRPEVIAYPAFTQFFNFVSGRDPKQSSLANEIEVRFDVRKSQEDTVTRNLEQVAGLIKDMDQDLKRAAYSKLKKNSEGKYIVPHDFAYQFDAEPALALHILEHVYPHPEHSLLEENDFRGRKTQILNSIDLAMHQKSRNTTF